MSKYKPTIGLEIHAELKTRTKMFCDCLNDAEEKHPNVNVCPICTGHPGTLPVINKKAVESVIKVGMALNGDIPQFSKFDRKNYFYPDLPKAYQISQYDLPLIFGGILHGIRLRRIHLEEDTGRLSHELRITNDELREEKAEKHNSKFVIHNSSYVDFNRSSVPLMELVTEPDIKNAEQAVEFARELQLILRYLGVSDADMEKGQMRVEANVSISADDNLGTKVEVKNINSFKAVHDAINYEIKRQEEVLSAGKKVSQETRGWDDANKKTVSQRSKEEAHDYRYFPEPDLPPLDLSGFDLKAIKTDIPELPHMKRQRFAKEYGLTPEQAEALVIDREMARFFEETASELVEEIGAGDAGASVARATTLTSLAFNYLNSDLRGLMGERGWGWDELKVDPENFADLVVLVANKEVSSRAAKDILVKMAETGLDPRAIMKQEGLAQVSDEGSLQPIVDKIISENPKAIEDYRKGKMAAVQFLVGRAMGILKGAGNPEVLRKLFETTLGK